MKALIDGDIVSYSVAAYYEGVRRKLEKEERFDSPEDADDWEWVNVQFGIDQLMKRILETTGAHDYQLFITGSNNFRKRINPEYKANRIGKPQPKFRREADAYLVTEFNARVTEGYEADDGIGIEARGDYVICTIDKDLNMIPGLHYNWRKDEFSDISPIDGLRFFYRQLLIGDTSDNVVGVAGIGPVKSARLINDLVDEADMFQVVQTMYADDQRLLMNGQCLWILREENKIWEFPHIETISGPQEAGPLQE